MSSHSLAANGCPIPDETHTLLVDKFGKRITEREARPGDVYAVPPPPYHYIGYIHPAGTDPNSPEARAREKNDRETLDAAILDLAQTPSGYQRLVFAHQENVKLQHNADKLGGVAAAINDQESNSLWLSSNKSVSALQLIAKHEVGHTEQTKLGLIVSDWHSIQSGLVGLRAQEASSYTDEAEHAVECEMITNPNHYKPPGVMDMFASCRPGMADAAKKAAPLLASGDRAGFRQAVHIAFYTPEQLEHYDVQLIHEFKRWLPKEPDCEQSSPEYNKFWNKMRVFMGDDTHSHETVSEKLSYLQGAPYSLDEPHLRGFVDTPKVRAAHAELQQAVAPLAERTGHHPKYQHFFVPASAFAQTATRSDAVLEIRAADRLLATLEVPLPEKPVAAESNLAVMHAREILPLRRQRRAEYVA